MKGPERSSESPRPTASQEVENIPANRQGSRHCEKSRTSMRVTEAAGVVTSPESSHEPQRLADCDVHGTFVKLLICVSEPGLHWDPQ